MRVRPPRARRLELSWAVHTQPCQRGALTPIWFVFLLFRGPWHRLGQTSDLQQFVFLNNFTCSCTIKTHKGDETLSGGQRADPVGEPKSRGPSPAGAGSVPVCPSPIRDRKGGSESTCGRVTRLGVRGCCMWPDPHRGGSSVHRITHRSLEATQWTGRRRQ